MFNSSDQNERYVLGEGTVKYKDSLGKYYKGFKALAKVVWEDKPTVFGLRDTLILDIKHELLRNPGLAFNNTTILKLLVICYWLIKLLSCNLD